MNNKREVNELLREFCLAVHCHAALVARTMGVPAADVHALGALQGALDGMSASELGRSVGLTPSATSALIDRLVTSQHAVRSVSSHDQRRARIEVTAHGKEESRARFTQLNDAIERALDHYEEEDVRLFAAMLNDISRAVRQAPDNDSPC